jgi:branched-chain amino acid transport system substrate-binding protein
MKGDLSRRFVSPEHGRSTAGAAGLLSAGCCCSPAAAIKESSAQSEAVLRIGYISPSTGPAAGIGEPNAYLMKTMRATFKDGLKIGSRK